MEINIIGIKQENQESALFIKHYDVFCACKNAGVESLPKETAAFFGSNKVIDSTVNKKYEIEIPYNNYIDKKQHIFEIKVEDIPEEVHTIKIYNTISTTFKQ
jgi:hypothetical protein